ncbi:hypothetical protein, partial [Streptomyces nanshensis]
LYRRERVELERDRRQGAAGTDGGAEQEQLVPVEEVAARLGYAGAREFNRAVREGRESSLGAADGTLPPASGRGRPRKAYRRARVEEAVTARRRRG